MPAVNDQRNLASPSVAVRSLNRESLDNIPRHLLLPPVIPLP